MYLTGSIHRDRLFGIAMRWLADRVEPGDGAFVTELFIYDNLITTVPVRRFLDAVQAAIHPGPVCIRRLTDKDALREAIIAGLQAPSDRCRWLLDRYRRHPEEYFPRTPADMVVAGTPEGRLIWTTRIKGIRRIAEKTSRRVAGWLSGAINARAQAFAEARAWEAGLPLALFHSNADMMKEDFFRAERAVSRSFKQGPLAPEPAQMRVDDVIGIKFFAEPEVQARIEEAIRAYPHARVAEREVHEGAYNDVNLLVDISLPPVGAIIDRAQGLDWSYAAGRGLPATVLARDFPDYVESGAGTFRAEVILATPEEEIESEFGRSIHEERTMVQRSAHPHSGRIATNASHIVEFLLMLAISPSVEVENIPVKMWGRYLPDTIAIAIWKLWGVEIGVRTAASFLPDPVLVQKPAGETPQP
ncbi:MAG: hypothetical protein FJ098_02025, partial [Deltaproteobacteria bacterium]|nr:hypothetical protein [Deltaproteobacteria bacterium]